MSKLKEFIACERGMETIEYAVFTALIVASVATAVTLLSAAISGQFGEAEGTIDGIGGG